MPRRSKWIAEFKFANWFQACNVARHILHSHELISDDEHDRIESQTKAIFPEYRNLPVSEPTGPCPAATDLAQASAAEED